MPQPMVNAIVTGRGIRNTFSLDGGDGIAEKTIQDYSPFKYGETFVEFDLVGITWDAGDNGKKLTFRLYNKINNTNLRVIDYVDYVISTTTDNIILSGAFAMGTDDGRITIQSNNALAGSYTIPYLIIESGK